MFLLIRRISPYTGADLLLGVFVSAEQAGAARADYLARYATGLASDPWHEQAYKAAGLVESDLLVRAMDTPTAMGAEVFVVSHYLDFFGQLVRQFDSLHASAEAAEARVVEVEAEDDSGYAMVQRVRIGVSLSDASDAQPSMGNPRRGDRFP